MLTHVVFFQLDERNPENAQKLRDALLSMQGKIPQIKQMEVGINVLESARAYDVALIQRFDSLETMQEYQTHPVHLAVLPTIRGLAGTTASVDYE
jgi:hypothetical protein